MIRIRFEGIFSAPRPAGHPYGFKTQIYIKSREIVTFARYAKILFL